MPLLKKKPSEIVRESKLYFSVEPGESQIAATVDYVGADHFLYASDIPHWDNEFPHNLHDLQGHKALSNETKEIILYKNAKALFALEKNIWGKFMARFVRSIVLFVASFVFSFFIGASARAAEPIRIAYSSVNPHALLAWIGEKRGLYAKYGLSSVLVYVPGGSVSIQALISGDIDLAQLTAPPGVIANLKGADIVYVAMTDDKMGYQLVTRQDVKKPADLKGKRLGISRFGSSSDFSTKVLLKKIGIDPKEVSILQIGNETQRLVALKSGRIDGSIFNAPFGAEAKKFNFNILADAGALNIPYFNTGMCGSTQMMQKNEARMLNFLRAYLEAIKIFKTEPEYTLKALSQFSKVNDQELVKEAYEYNRARIPDIPYPSLVAMQAVVDTLAETDPKAAKADAKKFINDRYLKKLEEEGFLQKLMGR